MGGHKLLIKKLAAFALAASFLVPGTAQAGRGNCEIVNVLSFHVEAKTERPVYVVGQTAVIDVTVVRPAREDPGGLGIETDPPESEPASDVNVGIALMSKNTYYVFGLDVTNPEGKARVEIPIEDYFKGGDVTAYVYAWKDTVKSACLTIREYGSRRYEKFFRVVNP